MRASLQNFLSKLKGIVQGIPLTFFVLAFVFRLITETEFLNLFVSKHTFQNYIKPFLLIKDNVEVNAVFGIIAALYIPPLIAIYSYSKNTNALYKLYIGHAFDIESVIKFLGLVFISQGSDSLVFIGWGCIIIFIDLKNLYINFKNFFFFKAKDTTLHFLKDAIGKGSKDRGNYLNVLKELDAWCGDVLGFRQFGKDDTYEYTWTHGVSRPSDVNRNNLDHWFEDFRENLKIKLGAEDELDVTGIQSDAGIEPNQIPEASWTYPFNIQVIRDDENLRLFLGIKYDKDYVIHNDENMLGKCFKKCFSFVGLDGEEREEIFKGYVEDTDIHLLSLIENKEFASFKEEILLVRDVVNLFKGDDSLSRQMVSLTFKILEVVKNTDCFKTYPLCRESLLDFWSSMFEAFMPVSNERYMDYTFRLLLELFNRDCLTKENVRELEREITSVLKYNKATKDFYSGYAKALVAMARRVVKNNDDHNDAFDFFVKLLQNLEDDVIKGYLNDEKDQDLNKIILKYSRQGRMFLAELMVYEGRMSYFERIVSSIDLSSFLSTFEQISRDDEREWRVHWWDEKDFDRHGVGGGWSFSPSAFHKNFLVEFFKTRKIRLKDLKETPNFKLKYLFQDAAKELKNNLEAKSTSVLDELCKQCENLENRTIAEAGISMEKVEEFLHAIHKEYNERKRISSTLSFKIVQGAYNSGFGYNTTLPKRFFVDQFNVVLSGFNTYGRGLAAGENVYLYKEIVKKAGHQQMELDKFFKEIIPKWISRDLKDFVVLTNHYDWRDRAFSWDGKCRINSDLKRVDSNQSSYKIQMDSKSIDVYRLAWSKTEKATFYMLIDLKGSVQGEMRLNKEEGVFENSFNYEVTDLSKDQVLRETIIKKGHYFKDSQLTNEQMHEELSKKVLFRAHVDPKVTFDGSSKGDVEIITLDNMDLDNSEE